jgi:phosphatidylinositol glycan class S
MSIRTDDCVHTGGTTGSNAFLSPQWGGVVILDGADSSDRNSSALSAPELVQPFRLFASQLRTLLGVPTLPSFFAASSTESLVTWEVDTLVKRRTIENVRESVDTLGAITKLAAEIKNMRVGEEVRRDVIDALRELDQVREQIAFIFCLSSVFFV